mmetsp:Transcript_5184/g.13020  ORF Transcript_5184/g.13020 Transcript_5184/m.13020 type:complete len:225 (-) Transcript_5184:401-1075(-)
MRRRRADGVGVVDRARGKISKQRELEDAAGMLSRCRHREDTDAHGHRVDAAARQGELLQFRAVQRFGPQDAVVQFPVDTSATHVEIFGGERPVGQWRYLHLHAGDAARQAVGGGSQFNPLVLELLLERRDPPRVVPRRQQLRQREVAAIRRRRAHGHLAHVNTLDVEEPQRVSRELLGQPAPVQQRQQQCSVFFSHVDAEGERLLARREASKRRRRQYHGVQAV